MEPRCKYFGVCGGCQNQHIAYAQQLENKRQRLQYLLQAQYGGEVKVHADKDYGYRNRMDFIVGPGKLVGFRQHDPKKLVDVEECPISDPRLNALLREVRAWVQREQVEPYEPKRRTGVLKYAVIRVADDAAVSFMLNEDSPQLGRHVEAVKRFAAGTSAEHVAIAYTQAQRDDSVSTEYYAVKGEENLVSSFLGTTLRFSSQGFFQNNAAVAQMMVAHVKGLVQRFGSGERTLVDAYGGVGTFGIALAPVCKDVISIESYPPGTEQCAENIRRNGVANMVAVNEDAGNMHKLDLPMDAIYLLDPPRSGLGEKALRYLLERKPETIVYVSCNPNQLSKELVQLGRLYSVEQADLFDMFPQTNHIEAVVLLRRK